MAATRSSGRCCSRRSSRTVNGCRPLGHGTTSIPSASLAAGRCGIESTTRSSACLPVNTPCRSSVTWKTAPPKTAVDRSASSRRTGAYCCIARGRIRMIVDAVAGNAPRGYGAADHTGPAMDAVAGSATLDYFRNWCRACLRANVLGPPAQRNELVGRNGKAWGTGLPKMGDGIWWQERPSRRRSDGGRRPHRDRRRKSLCAPLPCRARTIRNSSCVKRRGVACSGALKQKTRSRAELARHGRLSGRPGRASPHAPRRGAGQFKPSAYELG